MAETFSTLCTVDGKYFFGQTTNPDVVKYGLEIYLTFQDASSIGSDYRVLYPFNPGTYINIAPMVLPNIPTDIGDNGNPGTTVTGTVDHILPGGSYYGFGNPYNITVAQKNGLYYAYALLTRCYGNADTGKCRYTLYFGEFVQTSSDAAAGKWYVRPSWYYRTSSTLADPSVALEEYKAKLQTTAMFITAGTPGDSFSLYAWDVPIGTDGKYGNGVIGCNPSSSRDSDRGLALLKVAEYQQPILPDNPYAPLDPSGPSNEGGTTPGTPGSGMGDGGAGGGPGGGGGGTFTLETEPITIPSQPSISSSAIGFTRIYNPSISQLQALAKYLWTDDSVITTIWNHVKQFFENPMEALICLNLVPVPVPNGGSVSFSIMYIDTGISMPYALNQFVDVNCGTCDLPKYYGSALDFAPYTKVSLFLPFIGSVSLNTDEVMGRTIGIGYRVDIVSGNCVAYVMVDGSCLYQYSGHCAINIPFSAADFSSYINACINIAKLGSTLITGAATAPEAVAESINDIAQVTGAKPASSQLESTGRESSRPSVSTQASFAGIAPQNITNTVGAIMSSKPHIEHSGSFSGNSGYLGVRRPYLTVERPRACMPANYNHYNGYPCMMYLKLGDLTGYTKVQQIFIDNFVGTNPELAETMELLKGGVVI